MATYLRIILMQFIRAMGVKQGSPFRAGPVSEMELFKSVPVLTGESNYREWVTALKRVLDPINVNYFRVLKGDWPKPVFENEEANPEQLAECIQYGSTNTDLLLIINATIHQSVQSHIWNTFDGRSAFLALEEAFASPIRGTRFANYSNWVTTLYTSNNPEEFVRKWRRALEELHGWNDLANMSYTFVVCQFLVAVGCNPPARAWVKGLRLNVEYCDEAVLDNLIVDFLDFEDQRLKPPQVLLPALYSCVSRNVSQSFLRRCCY
jgi:hypothetical protein